MLWKKQCYGCEVDHPSQKQHDCMWAIPEHFYSRHLDDVVKTVWNERFVPAIMFYLQVNFLRGSEERVMGVLDAFLYELKNADNMSEKLEGKLWGATSDQDVRLHNMVYDLWIGEKTKRENA